MDDRGMRLELAGGIEDGKMVLRGEAPARDGSGKHVLNRLTREKAEGGKVRQTWDVSRDGGASWMVVFQGIYSRRS